MKSEQRKLANNWDLLILHWVIGVKNYIETLKDLCRKNGYSSTHWGRHRTIKEINEKNKNIRETGDTWGEMH